MSYHIKMSDEAEAKIRRIKLLDQLKSFLACLLFMGIGASMLYCTVILIQNAQLPAFESYVSPDEDKAPSKKPKVRELTSKSQPPSHVAPSVIVSTSAAAVAMAEIDLPTPDVEVGTGMDIDMGLGAGIGDALGTKGGGALGGSDAGGSTLEGTFYDLKLTRNGAKIDGYEFTSDGKLTPAAANKVVRTMGEFFDKNWDPNYLKKNYQSPTKLYTSYVVIPETNASYAPMAFKADDKVKPSAWFVIYRGKVRAPKTGRFRFVGIGDDMLAVRFNRKLVLEGGWGAPSMYESGMSDSDVARIGGIAKDANYQQKIGSYKGHEGYKLYPTHGLNPNLNRIFGGLTAGNIIQVEEGKVYPIEILLCEVGGQGMTYLLYMEDLDNPKEIDGMKVFDVFRTNFAMPDMKAVEQEIKGKVEHYYLQVPTFNEDSPIWVAVP